MSSTVTDMGNKESVSKQQNSGNMSSTGRDVDVVKRETTTAVHRSSVDGYKMNFQNLHKPVSTQCSPAKGTSHLLPQNEQKNVEETQSQLPTAPQRSSHSLPMTQARETSQHYANLPQQLLTSSGYAAGGNSIYSGQMIPPILMQQPMQVPTAVPGMFQTGFMYQTFSQGASKSNHMNSHFFPPFAKGSLIMLATGSLKPIEDLKTEDFIESAKVSKQLLLETSKIAKIQDLPNSIMSLIAFAVDSHESEVMVEKPSDHPFFVSEQGWASCKPDITLSRYGLPCQQLKVGDVCIFLSDKADARSDRIVEGEAKSAAADKEKRHFIQYNVPPNTENFKLKESGEPSGDIDTKSQSKPFARKDVEDPLLQPAGKKPRMDIPRTNVDIVKS